MILTLTIFVLYSNSSAGQVINLNKSLVENNQTFYGDLKIYTDKDVYLIGEKVNITVENIGNVGIGGSPKLYIKNITNQNSEHTVHTANPNDLPDGLYESENFTYSWDQVDENNTVVAAGLYLIHFYYVCCGGISIRNSTTFEIKKGPVSIQPIEIGIGLTIYLKNIATVDVYDIPCSMTVKKDSIIKISKTITMEHMKPDEIKQINFFPIGLGFYEIDIQTLSDLKTISCFLIGPFAFV